jgi:1-phosphofructokinase
MAIAARPGQPLACVFAPAPLLTVTIEQAGDPDAAEIHLHAGGQGYWIARLVAALGVPVAFCTTFGGEAGAVVRGILTDEGFDLRAVSAQGTNGAYVHDRRSGEREVVADMTPGELSRHDLDELYGTALVAGLEAAVTVLGGPGNVEVLPADTYRRLASDLGANGRPVIADLSGERLDAVLEGGVTVVKVSHEELLRDGRIDSDEIPVLVGAMARLRDSGAENVVLTRADQPTITLLDGRLIEVEGPRVEPLDHRGAGDSLTAGITAGLARGMDLEDAVRLGVAAGGLNVTRRGLGSGNREEIERLAAHVQARPLEAVGKR